MTDWDFIELKRLCQERSISDARVYRIALVWRKNRADYHAEMAKQIWSDLFKESFSLGDQRFNEAVFIYEAHVESCVFSLHAMADILAQIINVIVLRDQFKEGFVVIERVIQEMRKKHIALEVADKAKNLLRDNTFQYIGAFCNTIKHRRLLQSNFQAEYGEKARNESGLKFEAFQYKGHSFHQEWGSDIIGQYRSHLLSLITEIGLSINRYVSTMPLKEKHL